MKHIGVLVAGVVVLLAAAERPAAAQAACEGWIGVDSGEIQGAKILLDGKPTGRKTPDTLKGVPCGKHTVAVEKKLHKGGSQEVTIASGDVAKVSLSLTPNFGGLEVLSRPGGADVLLDGETVGKSPLKLSEVEAGPHTVQVQLPDHAADEKKVVIRPGKDITVRLKLVPDFGQLEVTSPVAGAIVWVDGDPLGEVPVDLKRVVTGRHTVRVTAELYKPFETKVVIKRGRQAKVKARLKPAYGRVTIDSRPEGARLRVDGKEVGQAPTTVKLAPGVHEVWAAGEGAAYTPVKAKVRVKLNGRHKMVLKLPVKTGMLMIDTVPFGGRIAIDGKKRGKAPLSLKEVPIGSHVLVARAKGLKPLHGRIEVVEGKRSVVEMNLKDPSKSVYKVPEGAPVAVAPKPEPKPEPKPKPVAKPEPVAKAEPKPEKKPEKKPEQREKKPEKVAEKKPHPAVDGAGKSANTEVSARAAAGMSGQRWAAWITGGAAVAAVVTAGAMFGVGYSKQTDADAAYEKFLENRTAANERVYEDLDEQAALYKNVGWGVLGGAVALGGVSLALFLTEPEPEVDVTGPADGFALSPTRGGAFATYKFRF